MECERITFCACVCLTKAFSVQWNAVRMKILFVYTADQCREQSTRRTRAHVCVCVCVCGAAKCACARVRLYVRSVKSKVVWSFCCVFIESLSNVTVAAIPWIFLISFHSVSFRFNFRRRGRYFCQIFAYEAMNESSASDFRICSGWNSTGFPEKSCNWTTGREEFWMATGWKRIHVDT